ncbi:hypothetical protein Efla_006371 [Eimeria flavescens]
MRGFRWVAALLSWLALQDAEPPTAAAAHHQQQQQQHQEEEVLVCEGHVRASQEHAAALGSIDLTAASVQLISEGGYYVLPLDESTAGRPVTLRVEGPPEWVFEAQEVRLPQGRCVRDVDFVVTGFAVAGEVVSYATGEGIEGIPLLLQPAAAPAAAAPAAGVQTVTKKDGSFALAAAAKGVSTVSVGAPSGGPSLLAFSPQQHRVEVDASGRVSPPRISFKLVAAPLRARGPPGLGGPVAAVLLLPAVCPGVVSANCGAPRLSAAEAAALLSPAALAAVPAEARGILDSDGGASSCATALQEETGEFEFPLAPLCSSWLLLVPLAPNAQQQQQQRQDTARLLFSPRAQQVKVSARSLTAEDFQLAGAAVWGRVVLQKGDKSLVGVEGASIAVDGVSSGVQTARDGSFLLPSVPLKPLTLAAEKEGFRFEPLHLERLPLPVLSQPLIQASGVSVCGSLPAGVEAQVLASSDSEPLIADNEGRVCFFAAPYSEVSLQLKGGGVSPSIRVLRVGGEPIPSAHLMHAAYTLRGTVKCSSSSNSNSSSNDALQALCSPQRLVLRILPPGGEPQSVPLQVQQQQKQQRQQVTLSFSLSDLAEGSYRLELTEKTDGNEHARICWQRQSLTVSLPHKAGEDGVEEEASDGGAAAVFENAGFQLRGSSSAPLSISLSPAGPHRDAADTVAAEGLSYLLPRGAFSLCVPCLDCKYTVNAAAWQRVEARPSVVSAAASSDAELLTKLLAQRVAVTVSVAPPRWAWQLAVEAPQEEGPLALLLPQPVEYHMQQQQQQQSVVAQQGEQQAPVLLPAAGGGAAAEGPSLQLAVRAGCRLEAEVSPPAEGVRVEFVRREGEAAVGWCVTGASGLCSSVLDCAALPSRELLAARAQQQGFDFVELQQPQSAQHAAADAAAGRTAGVARFLLRATKHSSVSVSVSDEATGAPLSGVLLSLFESGGSQSEKVHRQRKLTKETGVASFVSLPTGAFSIKPILKGYAFSPPLLQLQVAEGEELSVHLKGSRVAFDCRGTLRVVGNPAEAVQHTVQETLTVYAVAADGSRLETSVSPSGAYHLKALRPNQQYEIGVFAPASIQLEAVEPARRRIRMPAADLTGRPPLLPSPQSPPLWLDFVAFLPPPTSVLLSADISEGFTAEEAANSGDAFLVLLMPLSPSAAPAPLQLQHQQQQQQDAAAEAAAAASAAAASAAAVGAASEAAGDEPLLLPEGTVAAKMPATGVLLLSGVAAGSYKVVLIKARSHRGSTIPVRTGSKLLLASEFPVKLSPHAALRVSLPRLSRSVAADPPNFDPSRPLPPAQEEEQRGGLLTGLLVLAAIICLSAGKRRSAGSLRFDRNSWLAEAAAAVVAAVAVVAAAAVAPCSSSRC